MKVYSMGWLVRYKVCQWQSSGSIGILVAMIRVVTIHSILLVGLFSIVGSHGGVSLVGTQCDALLSIPKKQGASRVAPWIADGTADCPRQGSHAGAL